jgi:hypothetical protein
VTVRGWQKGIEIGLAAAFVALALALPASEAVGGERLAWTGGVASVEGAAGGGLVPWALIGGLGTEDQLGGSAFVTGLNTDKFKLRAGGIALALDDRVEVSYARQRFDIGPVVPGVTLGQDIAGLKVKLLGDAIFDQDRWWPQVAAGILYKSTEDFGGVPAALGAHQGHGTDFYLAATKLWLAGLAGRNVLVDVTLRHSNANQYGLVGFGGTNAAEWRPEGSVGVWLSDQVVLGVEYRGKRGGLAVPEEGAAKDAFVAWEPSRYFSVVLAYVNLGPVAFQSDQRGPYLSFTVMR